MRVCYILQFKLNIINKMSMYSNNCIYLYISIKFSECLILLIDFSTCFAMHIFIYFNNSLENADTKITYLFRSISAEHEVAEYL